MWLSTKQYAEMMGLNQLTVQKMCREGRIPNGEAMRVGKLWRIKIDR